MEQSQHTAQAEGRITRASKAQVIEPSAVAAMLRRGSWNKGDCHKGQDYVRSLLKHLLRGSRFKSPGRDRQTTVDPIPPSPFL